MKFSYTLLKKLSTKIPEKSRFIEMFNLHAFETESIGDDTLEISIPANRYSDAASHWGIAKVASAVFGGKTKQPVTSNKQQAKLKKTAPDIKILNKGRCARYLGRYLEISKMPLSPQWLKDVLAASGLRPINVVVDIMNYVMLEIGQPLHAFDFEKIESASDKKQETRNKTIEIRLAKQGEEISTIDGGEYKLSSEDLVIADDKGPIAIAGIKGGKRAEVTPNSRKIIVESANFDPVGIYKTARLINLTTDASLRFAHGMHPALAEMGIQRATELLKEICKAKVGELTDINYAKPKKTVLKFDVNHFNRWTGLNFKAAAAFDYLKKLGFKVVGKMVEVPTLRADIALPEDLYEEIVNLYGYEKLPSEAPSILLANPEKESQVSTKELARTILKGFGVSEVYNYSFVSRKDLTKYADPKWWEAVTLLNPVSADFQYLRPNLVLGMIKNVEDNFRFFDSVRIFEIGNVFKDKDGRLDERSRLGIALGAKKFGSGAGHPILELKGVVDQLLRQLGLTDFFFPEETWDMKYFEEGSFLRVESGDHHVLGNIGIIKAKHPFAYAELDLEEIAPLVSKEKEYLPIPKYPSVSRDISVAVAAERRVSEIQELIENQSRILEDVDLVDWFENAHHVGEGRKSLTFRLVFQAEDRTLTDEEVDREMAKIVEALQEQFSAEIR